MTLQICLICKDVIYLDYIVEHVIEEHEPSLYRDATEQEIKDSDPDEM